MQQLAQQDAARGDVNAMLYRRSATYREALDQSRLAHGDYVSPADAADQTTAESNRQPRLG